MLPIREHEEGEESKERKESRRETSPREGFRQRRVASGNAESEASPYNQVLRRAKYCRRVSMSTPITTTSFSSCLFLLLHRPHSTCQESAVSQTIKCKSSTRNSGNEKVFKANNNLSSSRHKQDLEDRRNGKHVVSSAIKSCEGSAKGQGTAEGGSLRKSTETLQ